MRGLCADVSISLHITERDRAIRRRGGLQTAHHSHILYRRTECY